MVDAHLGTRLGDSIQKAFQSYTTEFEKKAQAEKKRYINLIEKSMKDIINDENVVLAKSSSQPQSTYEVATSLTEFELKKILLDKIKIAEAKKPPLSFDELMSTPIDFSAYVMNNLKINNLTQEHLVGPAFNLLKRTCRSRVKLEYNIEECYKAVTDQLDWNNLKRKEYPFDLSKPLPLIMDRGHQVVLVDYFINNDLEYLRGGSSRKKYTTSTTKTKAVKYDIPGIEDMVPSLWSPIKVAFKDGDFLRLHLYDIEDMLLLLVQKKLSNLERDVIFDLGVVLRMFTIHIVILKWVEDLQMGVESYQKMLNITKPDTFRSDITNRTPYTTYNNPQGIIYEVKYKRNRLMRTDELYKFSDGTLTFVRSVLHDIALNLRMDYLPKRRWSSLDRKRSRIMIKAINKQLLERRLMRSLEKFVGGRDYGEDLRLLQRTI
ncbi:hypothetical protein Tco_0606002 [Tanacetum coccineum]